MVTLIGEEGRNSGGSAWSVVVGKLREREEARPVVLLIVAVDPEVLLKGLINTLGLSIAFRVVSGGEVESHVQGFSEGTEEVRDELRSAVRGDMTGNSVLGEDVENK